MSRNLSEMKRANNSNAADRRKPLVVSSRLSAAADLSRYAAGVWARKASSVFVEYVSLKVILVIGYV
jgi:hypothetical protein